MRSFESYLERPPETRVTCQGNICCYPSDRNVMMCFSSDRSSNIIMYFKVIEK